MSNQDKVFMQTEIITLKVDQVKELITEAVTTGMTQCGMICPISKELGVEINHAFGMVKDVGDGKVDRGIEVIRGNHMFMKEMRGQFTKIFNKIVLTITVVLLGGLGTILWIGIRQWIGKQ